MKSRITWVIGLAITAGFVAGSDCPDDYLHAAACKRDITPITGPGGNHSDPIYMAGFGNDRHATGVHDPLWARGIVLKTPYSEVAIITLDVVGYFFNEVQTIRGMVDHLGLDGVIVTSTHNHEGPDTLGLWGPSQFETGVDLGYLDFVNQEVADCIEEAYANAVPAEIRLATGDTIGTSLPPNPDLVGDGKVLQAFQGDQALVLSDGSVVEVEGDAGKIINPSVPILQVREKGKPDTDTIATLVNYASHPEALADDNTLITSDFPHFMRENLEARYGGTAIYVSADLGVLQGPLSVDLLDPDTGEVAEDNNFHYAEIMGNILAERVKDALRFNLWMEAPRVRFISRPFAAELANPFFNAAVTFGILGRRELPLSDPGDPSSPRVGNTEVSVLQIGGAQIVVTPNELDPQIGDYYRSLMTHANHKFIFGLGNDEVGYQMPVAKFDPTCYDCFIFVLGGNEENCPTMLLDGTPKGPDCSTVFFNNVNPDVDPLLQAEYEELIALLNQP